MFLGCVDAVKTDVPWQVVVLLVGELSQRVGKRGMIRDWRRFIKKRIE